MPRSVAIATCRDIPEVDVDEAILRSALEAQGIVATWVDWEDATVDYSAFQACVVRSTWNYHLRSRAFLVWAERVGRVTRLFNDASTIRANADKGYLVNFGAQGIPIVPTQLLPLGATPDFGALGSKFVLKPVVSAGSYLTRAFVSGEAEAANAFLERIWAHGDAMAQPYIDSVDDGGEIAWIWIDGEVTHGIRKRPRFDHDDESVTDAITPTARDLIELEPFVKLIPHGSLYARIDVMETESGWLLSELELIEPSLFMQQYPQAADAFASAIARRLDQASSNSQT